MILALQLFFIIGAIAGYTGIIHLIYKILTEVDK